MRKLLIIVVMALVAATAHGQSTQVQATILDPSGKPYVNASVTANFINPSGLAANWNGFPMQATTWSTNANSAAFFTMQLPDLAFIAPATGTFYTFTICSTTPPVTGQPAPPCFVYTSPALPTSGAITGASINISAAIQAVSLPLSSGNCPLSGTVPCQFISTFGTPPVVPPAGQSSFTFNTSGAPVVSINGGPFFPFGGSGTFASLNLPNVFTAANQFQLGAELGPISFASLGSPPDGTIAWCPDCQVTAPCLGGGTGAFAQRGNGAWSCTGGGGGGGGGVPGGSTNNVQSNCGGVFCGNNSFLYNTATSTVTFPDGSTWASGGLFPPSPTTNNALIVDSSSAESHAFVFRSLINGQVCLQGGGVGFNSVCVGGDTYFGGPPTTTIAAGDSSSHTVGLELIPFANSHTDQLGYTFANGGVAFSSDLQPLPGSMFAINRVDKSIHVYGPLYLPNAAISAASAGVAGAIPVSRGSGSPFIWSSDLSGPFEVVGTFGTPPVTPSGSQGGIAFGASGYTYGWDSNSSSFQLVVLANNVPATGITGLIEPAQIDTGAITGLGTLFQPLSFASQYNVPEMGSAGALVTGPLNDAADNIVSTTELINLATSSLGPGVANCSSTGTTFSKLVKLSSSGGNTCVVIASITDTQGDYGICAGRCGTTGTAVLARVGLAPVITDNNATVNDYLINSSSVAGDVHDTGSTTCPVTGSQVIGRVQATAVAGNNTALLGGCDTTGGGGGGGLADPGSNGLLSRTALNTTVARVLTAGSSNISITNGDGTAGNPTVDIGSSVVTLTGTQTLTNKTLTTPIISSISNTGTLTLPTSSDTLTGRATADTLTNKTATDPTNTVSLLNVSGPQSAIVGTAAAANIYSYTIPGGSMGANTCIRVTASFVHSTGSASVTYQWSYGGSTGGMSSFASVSVSPGKSSILICNNGATNSQQVISNMDTLIGSTSFAAAQPTFTKDTTLSQAVALTFTVAATDQVTPKLWMVESVH